MINNFDKFKIKFSKGGRSLLPPKNNSSRRAGAMLYALNKAHYSLKGANKRREFKNFQNLQKSIVKTSYIGNNYSCQWRKHGSYLQREGAQKEHGKGEGFNATDNNVNIEEVVHMWQKEGDERLFKIIISPEQGVKIDIKRHSILMMEKIQKDCGTKIEWAGIDHQNTDNPHAHIVVRGKLANGLELRFNKEYIKRGMRLRSQEVATKQLGIRLEKDILERRKSAIEKKMVTELDRDIDKLKMPHGLIVLSNWPKNDYQNQKRNQIIGRLMWLEKEGLAKRKDSISWRVDNNYIESLKAYQLKHDIIKGYGRFYKKIANKELPLVLTTLEEGERVVGKVVGFGMDEGRFESRYMLIEGADGKVHYMKANLKILKERDSRKIKNGDVLYLEGRMFRKEGKEIKYMYIKNYDSFKVLKEEKKFQEIDLYILDIIRKAGRIPKINKISGVVRKDFICLMKERVEKLKELKIVDDNLSVNRGKVEKARRKMKMEKTLSNKLQNLERFYES